MAAVVMMQNQTIRRQAEDALARGVLVVPAGLDGSLIQATPPLSITQAEVDEAARHVARYPEVALGLATRHGKRLAKSLQDQVRRRRVCEEDGGGDCCGRLRR